MALAPSFNRALSGTGINAACSLGAKAPQTETSETVEMDRVLSRAYPHTRGSDAVRYEGFVGLQGLALAAELRAEDAMLFGPWLRGCDG